MTESSEIAKMRNQLAIATKALEASVHVAKSAEAMLAALDAEDLARLSAQDKVSSKILRLAHVDAQHARLEHAGNLKSAISHFHRYAMRASVLLSENFDT